MTIQTVVREICAPIGVRPPTGSLFVSPYQDRTPWEFVQLANEMAQRIAFDTRDWQALRKICEFTGDGVATSFPLPTDYHRMLESSEVWRSTNTNYHMSFVSDPEEWLRRAMLNYNDPMGEWIISNDEMNIRPVLAAGEVATFWYLRNTPVKLSTPAGALGTQFLHDDDVFALPERLLKLGMIWQWKANKGATYAEDLANYEDALTRIAGADKPSPIIIG